MPLDAATLLISNALLSTAAAGVMAVVLRTRKTYPGFAHWTAGIACLALGAGLLIPDLLPAGWTARMLRNGALMAGHVLLLRGMLLFRGMQVGGWLEGAVAALFLGPFAYLSLDAGQLGTRIAYYCLFSGALNLATVWVTWRRRPAHYGSNDTLLGFWLMLFAFISLVRGVQELSDISTAFESLKGFGSIYALAQILSVQLITLTLISMNSQRIEWEHRANSLRLQDSEQQLRLMGDNLPAGFIYRYVMADGQRRFEHISGGVTATFGLDAAALTADATPLFSLMPSETISRYLAAEAHSAETLSDYNATLRFELPDGRVRWLDVRSHPQRRPDGSVFWDGVALDVSESRRAADDLQRYKALADSSEDAIISNTLQGSITGWNRGAERLLGLSAAEALGRNIQSLVPDELTEPESEILARVAQGDSLPHFDTVRLHRDGRRLNVSVAISPIRDAEGHIVGASTIARDITERLASRSRAQRQSALYRCLSQCNAAVARCDTPTALFEAVCGAIIDVPEMRSAWVSLLDPSGDIVVQSLGGSAADLPLESPSQPEAARPTWSGPAGSAIRSGLAVWSADAQQSPPLRPWPATDTPAGLQAYAALPVRRGDAVVGALTICADEAQAFDAETRRLLIDLAANISFALGNFERDAARAQAQDALSAHRQQLEVTVASRTHQLAEASQRAEAASLAKSAFLANMSHEIRTPLNAMIGMAHLIRREALSPQQTDRLLKLETAAKHLLDILNAVLDLSKIEAGKMTLESVPIQVPCMVANTLSMLEDRADAKQIQVSSDVGVVPDDLIGDPTRLQQALLNYANNAIKFTEHGSVSLRVRTLRQDPRSAVLRFEVQDTGIGIDPAVMPRLFTAFEQADPSTTRHAGGTGLGLAITQRLAQLMGGEAGATSTPGQGSCFWFTVCLPRAAAASAEQPHRAAGDAEAALRERHRGARVLLAEDNVVNAEVAQAILEDVGLVVDVAEDGAIAVARALASDYNLILMDMQMPRMDGLDACRAIRSQSTAPQAVPIIAMTANAFAEDKALCQAAGMDDFLSKPVDPALLYGKLLRWLDERTTARPKAH